MRILGLAAQWAQEVFMAAELELPRSTFPAKSCGHGLSSPLGISNWSAGVVVLDVMGSVTRLNRRSGETVG